MSRLVITRRSTTWKRSLRSSEAAVEIPSSTRQAAGSRRTSRKPCFTRFSPSKRLRSRRRFKVPAVAAVREAQARQRAASGTRSASASARSLRNAKRKRVSAQPQEIDRRYSRIRKQRAGIRAHRRLHMIARWPVHIGVVAVTAAILFAFSPVEVKSQRNTAGRVTVGAGDLGGVVTSTKGPEAGVWVIAETTDLPTKLAKIVVTDDQGRYLIPDLPKANYNVWVRGYGLVDSPKVTTALGKTLDL